ncbi:hypothetical protein V8G54_030743 [Vigna mungo]|uniref:Uncharacterized protein n=1 Tax=Vigna mungo TaxID=3915 RepID=A0AAQ3RMP6_VIGMU
MILHSQILFRAILFSSRSFSFFPRNFHNETRIFVLQPWLGEEPHLDLQLGFLHSLAVFTNLSFDVSSLNCLFDVPAFLFFKDLTVDRITFRFSTWFLPAFTIELHGVRVMQSFE